VTGPLVTAAWLLEHADDPAVRIADTRWYLADPTGGHAAYHEGHIPDAVYVSLDHHLSAPEGPGRHPLPDREDFAVCMGSLGFGDDHLVVAYDDRGGAIAARLWWMLRDIGHDRVAVLDGGIQAWTASGGDLETEPPSPVPATMTVRAPLTTQIDRETLRQRLGTIPLIDARAPDRYRGETEPIDPVAGHIPTARNAPYEGNLNEDLTFADAAELRHRFESLGAGDETVVYCGSGVTACHGILAMTVAGLPEPTLYPGSWSDWSTSRGPVATGDE
jgi:thiosulfate/3-mercaptopyruvate sulfurtransferase